MIPSLPAYEKYIYSLPEKYPSIEMSKLVVKTTSAHSAQIIGTLYFDFAVGNNVLHQTRSLWNDS